MDAVNDLIQPGIELSRKDEERGEASELLQEEACRTAAAETSSLKSCSSIIFWKCQLWMVITSVFLLLILVITLSLILYSVVHIDEDEYWDPELIASGKQHNFSGIVNIKCPNPNVLLSESAYNVFSTNLNKRLKDVYSYSPALGRYFTSSEVTSFRQNIYDKQNISDLDIPECTDIILDPSSVTIRLI
ncbi:TPA-induced transmembrane protein [Ophiophagus hannah]|uniref:TPA-induced transmembrane protein n=1 Tax=Ophiophagus hannah TaxID=8665 RepID=V8P5C5_OPHHA|nr:TPA-induced transmembrane protein [Ophiophagus hannah]